MCNEIEGSYDKIIITIVPSYTGKNTTRLLLMLCTRNNTDGNKLVIFSGIALYYGDTYILLEVVTSLRGSSTQPFAAGRRRLILVMRLCSGLGYLATNVALIPVVLDTASAVEVRSQGFLLSNESSRNSLFTHRQKRSCMQFFSHCMKEHLPFSCLVLLGM